MEENLTISQNVDTLFSNLENFTQNEGLIGKPVTHEDKTFIPVVSLTLGYGTGNTASKNQGSMASGGTNPVSGLSNMSGGALGLGAKLSTDAIIVIDNNKVSMMQMSAAASSSQIMDKIPQILSGMTGQAKQQGQQQGQQQQS